MKYRILGPGDVLRVGDEINDGEWRPIRYTVGETLTEFDGNRLFRRPLGGFTPRVPESAFARIASVVRRIFLR